MCEEPLFKCFLLITTLFCSFFIQAKVGTSGDTVHYNKVCWHPEMRACIRFTSTTQHGGWKSIYISFTEIISYITYSPLLLYKESANIWPTHSSIYYRAKPLKQQKTRHCVNNSETTWTFTTRKQLRLIKYTKAKQALRLLLCAYSWANKCHCRNAIFIS